MAESFTFWLWPGYVPVTPPPINMIRRAVARELAPPAPREGCDRGVALRLVAARGDDRISDSRRAARIPNRLRAMMRKAPSQHTPFVVMKLTHRRQTRRHSSDADSGA